MATIRQDRVGDLIQEEIAQIVQRGELKDPRVGFVTIMHVTMSPDLSQAKVFFSVLGSKDEVKENTEGLNSASGFIRRRLAKALKIKKIPHVYFVYDDSLEYSTNINKLLKEAAKEDG